MSDFFKLLLFPGLFFHEMFHYLFCIFFKVKVMKFSFFPDFFVEYEHKNPYSTFYISLAPLFLFLLVFLFGLFFFGDFSFVKKDPFLFYFYVSVFFLSPPGKEDIKEAEKALKEIKGIKPLLYVLFLIPSKILAFLPIKILLFLITLIF